MIGISIILYIAQVYFGINLGGDTLGILFYAVIIWFSGSFISLLMSKGMAKRMYNIHIIDETKIHTYDPKVQLMIQIIQEISQWKWIKFPEIGYYESAEPNAFATWPSKNSALVAASTWLLNKMNEEEIKWVIAHEMAHVLNGDMVTMTLLQGIMNTFVFFLSRILSRTGWEGKWVFNPLVALGLQIVFGMLGSVVVNQFSQYREYKADEGSAQIFGKNPMIAALQKLQSITQWLKVEDDELATMKIFGSGGGLMRLFSTHPSLESRIARLNNM